MYSVVCLVTEWKCVKANVTPAANPVFIAAKITCSCRAISDKHVSLWFHTYNIKACVDKAISFYRYSHFYVCHIFHKSHKPSTRVTPSHYTPPAHIHSLNYLWYNLLLFYLYAAAARACEALYPKYSAITSANSNYMSQSYGAKDRIRRCRTCLFSIFFVSS